MNAYISVEAAVARSIDHNEITTIALPEDISGIDSRIGEVLEQLEEFGLEDSVETGYGVVEAWGTTDAGEEWRIETVDGLTQDVRYTR